MQDKKEDKSQEMIQDAKQNVAEANLDLNNAIEKFKIVTVERISANEKKIAEFKDKIAGENAENKAKLENKLAELEQKNKEMKAKLAAYKNNGNEQWDEFKTEFNHDMKELGKAFSDLTVKNTN
jgi:hypothetical protein